MKGVFFNIARRRLVGDYDTRLSRNKGTRQPARYQRLQLFHCISGHQSVASRTADDHKDNTRNARSTATPGSPEAAGNKGENEGYDQNSLQEGKCSVISFEGFDVMKRVKCWASLQGGQECEVVMMGSERFMGLIIGVFRDALLSCYSYSQISH